MKKLQQTYLGLLKEFISFKTISTDTSFRKETDKAVSWLEKLFKKNGFKITLIKGKNHNPVIIARFITDPALKTILVYGHYDVQPASPEDGWKQDPFTLTKKGKKYVARGVVDNKGQILAHMVAVFDAIEMGRLSSNVTFVIEGNEESGNPYLAGIIRKNKKLLACDLVVISDGEMIGTSPTLDVSLRGGGNMTVVYETSSNDHHSGIFGGLIPNAALELSRMLAKMKTGMDVSFGSFYKGIPEKSEIGLDPVIEVSGFSSGYTGAGYKNIIPGKAEARLNIRTVYPQVASEVIKELEMFIKKETPAHVKVKLVSEKPNEAIFLDSDHADIEPVKKLLAKIHDEKIRHQHVGGSIPVVADFVSILKKPMALVPLVNDDCNMHGVDENFSEYHMKKALEFTSALWKK